MSDGFAALGALAIGAHPDETAGIGDPLANRLLRGDEVETVILARVTNRPVAPQAETGPADAIGALAIGDAALAQTGEGADEAIFVSDGAWCGAPDDFGAAHLEADLRIIDVGSYTEEVPYLPEQDRRSTTTAATMALANGDGRYDDFFGSRTTDGQTARFWLAAAHDGYSKDWIPFADALCDTLDPELDEARIELRNVAYLLETGALRETYAGKGGASGDARLAGKFTPLAFGSCFNVEPDTEDFAAGIDRWTAGRLDALAVVKDKGAPLLWDGNDWPDYASLKAASVSPGFFTKALAIGRSKRGDAAAGRITGDIVAPHDTTAEILLALARGPAGLPEELIDAASFGALPDYKVDLFLKGDRAVTVAEVFDALLRPFNAWYGALGDRKLRVGIVDSPTLRAESWRVESWQVDEDSLGVKRFDVPPRWRMGVTGARNWTPMAPSELIDWTENPAVSQADWERLQREEEHFDIEDSGVKNRHAGAFDAIEKYGRIRGYFTDRADIETVARARFEFLKRFVRRVTFRTGLNAVFARPGDAGRLAVEGRFGLDAGAPALIARRVFNAEARAFDVTSLVIADAA